LQALLSGHGAHALIGERMKPKILALLLLASCAHKPTWEQATGYCYREHGANVDELTNASESFSFMHTYEMGAYAGCLFGIMDFQNEEVGK